MVVINFKLDGTLHSCDNVLLCQRFVIQVKVKFTPKVYGKEGKLEYFRICMKRLTSKKHDHHWF